VEHNTDQIISLETSDAISNRIFKTKVIHEIVKLQRRNTKLINAPGLCVINNLYISKC